MDAGGALLALGDFEDVAPEMLEEGDRPLSARSRSAPRLRAEDEAEPVGDDPGRRRFRRSCLLLSSILWLTPTLLDSGISTTKRPGRAMLFTRAPFVPRGPLVTCTITCWPGFRRSLDLAPPQLAPPDGRGRCCRAFIREDVGDVQERVAPRPMSTNAASAPGSTFITIPLKMDPTTSLPAPRGTP